MGRRQTKREPWEEAVESMFSDASTQEFMVMAKTYFAYYVSCRSVGFNNEQAMQMVVALQTLNLQNAIDQQRKGKLDG